MSQEKPVDQKANQKANQKVNQKINEENTKRCFASVFTATAIPLPMNDVDTDLIIPADYLKVTTKEGLGQFLFKRLCDREPNFPLNLPQHRSSQILVARDNFGCGSSREHASWALKDWGIRVVLATSFADIFYSNALKNFLLPIALPAAIIEKILNAPEIGAGKFAISIDLEKQEVSLPGGESASFLINPYRKECLQNEIGDMEYLLFKKKEIEAFDAKRRSQMFFKGN
jgi:3-isopropylmalate/(R)-2-methylmalate dehydratase small subunit